MNFFRLGGAVLLLALVPGCPKREGARSPEFEKARDRYFSLQAADPVGVFGNPEVKTLLPAMDGVPDDSVEKPAAVELAKTLREGIAAAEKEAADREKSVAASNKMPDFVPAPPGESAPSTPESPPPAQGPARDAGYVDPGPSAGMAEAEFASKYGNCFSKKGAYTDDKGVVGETYSLNEDAACQKRLPTQVSTMILMAGGKIASIVPKSAVVSTQSFTMGTGQDKTVPAPAPPPAPPPPPRPAPPPVPSSAAPVLPPTASDQITTPPVDPNVNPDAINK